MKKTIKLTESDLINLVKRVIKESKTDGSEVIDEKYIFIRTDKFDNTGTIRELPYKGIHCWCIYEKDYDKYINELELWGGNEKDVRIVTPGNRKIFAIDYPLTHDYVMGDSDVIPNLEPFNPNKHIMRFIKQSGKSMLDYVSDMKYQIIMI